MKSGVQQAGPGGSSRSRPGPLVGVVAVAGCLLVLGACARGPMYPPQAGDTAVATVDDETIWASDVKREALAQGLIGDGEALDIRSGLFHRVLDEVVDQKLLAGEALKRRMQADPLASRRLAAARERVLGDLLVESVVAQAVNDNAVRSLYAEQLKLAKLAQEYRISQIVTAQAADADAARKLLAAGAAFPALATARSIDAATRASGGDLGYLTADVMPDAYAGALKSAKTGDVVGPFKTDAGWVLLKVEDVRLEKPVTLDEARPQIVRFLTYDQVRALLERLRSQSKVELLVGPARADEAAGEPASAPAGPPTAESLLTGPPPGASFPSLKVVQPKSSP